MGIVHKEQVKMKIRKRKERGQALAEYAVIYPGAILLVIAAAWFLGPSIGDIYRHVTSIIAGQKPCVTFNGSEDNAYCDQNEDCRKTDYEGEQSGTFVYDDELSIDAVVIKAGRTYAVRRDDPYQFEYVTDDGCYKVTFKTNRADWERIGSGSGCQDVSHIDYWSAPLCTAE
jgi:hypothetical protein